MYRTCLFCETPFPANESIEELPVGRRLAFDQAKGRLWVVCRKCERWNLVPIEERWEAIEACERAYRDTRLRAATDNVGLARLADGTELVRIGQPLRPEFAAWRYGDQFGRRRHRTILYGIGGAAVVGGLAIGGLATGIFAAGAFNFINVPLQFYNVWNVKRNEVRFTTHDGVELKIPAGRLREVRLQPGHEGLALEVPQGRSAWRRHSLLLTGADAERLAGLLMPKVNRHGASKAKVQDAVQLIEEAGGPLQFMRPQHIDANLTRWGRAQYVGETGALWHLPTPVKLAMEMALHEEAERAALEGELTILAQAWREAEEVAEIADGLALPESVEERARALRAR